MIKSSKELIEVMQSFSLSSYIYSMCELGIYDHLKDEVQIQELSSLLQIEQSLLYRLLRPSIALGFVDIIGRNHFKLTRVGLCLSRGNSESLVDMIIMLGQEGMPCWYKLYPAVQKGVFPFEICKSEHPFTLQAECEEQFIRFDRSMARSSNALNFRAFFDAHKEINGTHLVDIGGGSGTIIFKFLEEFPLARATILDLPFVKNAAEKNILSRKLSDRCKFVSQDFFEPFSVCSDYFILSRVLHDWSDAKARVILENIKRNMTNRVRLFVIEKIIPEQINEKNLKCYMDDLNVWAMCGGKERTQHEFEELFASAGLQILSNTLLDKGKCLFTIGTQKD